MYLAFIEVARGATKSLVPIAVTVPMRIACGGQRRKGIDVCHETYSTTEGDWVYYSVNVPRW